MMNEYIRKLADEQSRIRLAKRKALIKKATSLKRTPSRGEERKKQTDEIADFLKRNPKGCWS